MEMFKTTRIGQGFCYNCNTVLDAASGESGRRPMPGDITLCIKCGSLHVINEDFSVSRPSKQEMDNITKDRDLACSLDRMFKALKAVGKDNPGRFVSDWRTEG